MTLQTTLMCERLKFEPVLVVTWFQGLASSIFIPVNKKPSLNWFLEMAPKLELGFLFLKNQTRASVGQFL